MTLEAGSTFLNQPTQTLPQHLWIIISDPEITEDVAFVSLTSYDGDKDASCLLDVGDHPFIKHLTCVYYREAKVQKLEVLKRLLSAGQIIPKEPLEPGVLSKIRLCARDSPFTPLDVIKILQIQKLI